MTTAEVSVLEPSNPTGYLEVALTSESGLDTAVAAIGALTADQLEVLRDGIEELDSTLERNRLYYLLLQGTTVDTLSFHEEEVHLPEARATAMANLETFLFNLPGRDNAPDNADLADEQTVALLTRREDYKKSSPAAKLGSWCIQQARDVLEVAGEAIALSELFEAIYDRDAEVTHATLQQLVREGLLAEIKGAQSERVLAAALEYPVTED